MDGHPGDAAATSDFLAPAFEGKEDNRDRDGLTVEVVLLQPLPPPSPPSILQRAEVANGV